MAEFEEKTEQATPRKRQKAKEKGQVARSRDLMSIASTGGVIIMFFILGQELINRSLLLTAKILRLHYGTEPMYVLGISSKEAMLLLLPLFGMAVSMIIMVGLLQGGPVLKPLNIEIERLNPVNGLKRLFSLHGLFELLKSLLKFCIGGIIFYFLVRHALHRIPYTPAMSFTNIELTAVGLIKKAVLTMFIAFSGISLLDYLHERFRFERSIRMTKEELKEEYKETEGDPLIRSRIKSIQKELARRRMMQEVPKATVVITNPMHIAVALLYKKDEMPAPKVIAKGAGYIAEKIKEIATLHSVPIVEDKPLARALYKLKIGSYIPEELYRAVARILAYIYKARGMV